MIKQMICLVALLVFAPFLCLAENEEPFRLEDGIIFGMNIEDVKEESRRDFHYGSKTELVTNTTLYDIDATVALTFGENNELYEIICWLDTKELKTKYCISDFEDVSRELVDRYGEASTAGSRWKSKEAYEQYGDDMITAIEKKKAVLFECWNFTDVYIVHILEKTKSNEIQHFLNYYSPLLHPDIDELKDKFGY